MKVYEMYTKKGRDGDGRRMVLINIEKMWIMWISRCITAFSRKMDKNGCA
jgi:hypothetical protein